MKAISLLQPWAILVAVGAKCIETRSWKTSYRGPLAIHASAGYISGGRRALKELIVVNARMHSVLVDEFGFLGRIMVSKLPLGRIVATCNLIAVKEIRYSPEKFAGWAWTGPDVTEYKIELTDQEKAFGDYTPGRYAWLLDNIQRLDQPVPAKGKLGLWEWNDG